MKDINNCSVQYRKYLQSEDWQRIRENILCRDEFKCRLCGANTNLHVHHIRGIHRFHESEYPEDLVTLCERCHTMIHVYWQVVDSIKEYYDNKRHEERIKRGLY